MRAEKVHTLCLKLLAVFKTSTCLQIPMAAASYTLPFTSFMQLYCGPSVGTIPLLVAFLKDQVKVQ